MLHDAKYIRWHIHANHKSRVAKWEYFWWKCIPYRNNRECIIKSPKGNKRLVKGCSHCGTIKPFLGATGRSTAARPLPAWREKEIDLGTIWPQGYSPGPKLERSIPGRRHKPRCYRSVLACPIIFAAPPRPRKLSFHRECWEKMAPAWRKMAPACMVNEKKRLILGRGGGGGGDFIYW